MKHVLITGGAGFIGSHLVDSLLADNYKVTCIDNFDAFYAREIKEKNIAPHRENPNYQLLELDIRDYASLEKAANEPYDIIVHLAAKAGVRPSIQDPIAYQQVNVQGTQNMLELAKKLGVKQFVFASSSSVYGVNPNVPWREDDHVLMPISPYAATKVSGELLGHVYSHLYGIRFIALRFFTVFGPRQRPDLAIHKFSKRMLEGTPIQVFGDGTTRRDYTYIDDIIQGIRKAMAYEASLFEVINLGNNTPVTMNELLAALESALGVAPKIERLPEQPGDVPQTYASIENAQKLLGYQVTTPILEGLQKFNDWIRGYYKF
ncbi:NAD-dependent epimerase/dehydratase [Chloroherpeton thalassium ATCC 35110]|uniref:NAD-dependent epimerase/dehydratase n=1 Tax=Chloroherpeton thalassium (strain ATCC 35110 / GB-78) TaxID=517418 RepID=B3QXL6_CHLT3|nr:NAD-dependent epimerase/dehydratase family protein [Chloroherpeton thalassium]ACF14931.1 NAD-dependent epimerase/dehydratase [Chloroherpeton thalassium ATCC 35110]